MYTVKMCSSTELVGMNKTQKVSGGHVCKCKSVGQTHTVKYCLAVQRLLIFPCVCWSPPHLAIPCCCRCGSHCSPLRPELAFWVGHRHHWAASVLGGLSSLHFVNPCRGRWQKIVYVIPSGLQRLLQGPLQLWPLKAETQELLPFLFPSPHSNFLPGFLEIPLGNRANLSPPIWFD